MAFIGVVWLVLPAFDSAAFAERPNSGGTMDHTDTIPLTGRHRFRLGDHPQWSEPEFDDSRWSLIDVPADWDAMGIELHEYLGWYRIRFDTAAWVTSGRPAVSLGAVSDADEVWLNGVKIGGLGTIADRYETAAFVPRLYSFPASLLKSAGENVLAVRVMRVYYAGGLTDDPALPPMIGDVRDLAADVRRTQRTREIVLAVLITIWTIAIVVGLTLFQQSELGFAFRYLAVAMLQYVIAYTMDLPQVVTSAWHSPNTELAVNLMISTAPWMLLHLTAGMLQQKITRRIRIATIVGCGVLAAATLYCTPADRGIMLVCSLVGVLMTGVTGVFFCLRAVVQRIPGARVYAVGLFTLFAPTLCYAFPHLIVTIGGIPLDAYAAAGFVLSCFSVLMIRYRNLRQRVELASKALLSAQEEERKRLSRDLHDGVSQSVFAIRLALQMTDAQLRAGKEVAETALSDLITETENVGEELRRVVRELRPSVLEKMNLVEAIAWLAEQLEGRCDHLIQVKSAGNTSVAEPVKDHLYRIWQEAVQNVVQHAEAKNVTVFVDGRGEWLHLQIRDDGKGFAHPDTAGGHGLTTMNERAELLGGTASIDGKTSAGTTIDIHVPRGFA